MFKEENERTVQEKVLCENIATEFFPFIKEKSGKGLKKKLRKTLSDIRNACMRAEQFSEKDARLSDPFLWLCDNFSFIEEELLVAIDELSHSQGTFSACGYPLAFVMTKELIYLKDGVLDESSVRALICGFDNAVNGGISFHDRESFPLFVKCAVLCYISDTAKNLSEKAGVLYSDDDSANLINAIKTLSGLSAISFSEIFSDTKTEKLLLCDPSGAYGKMDEASKFHLRKQLHNDAKKRGISDTEYAAQLLETALKDGSYIGKSVNPPSKAAKLFFPALYVFTAMVTGFTAYLTHPLLFPLLFFPTLEAIKPIFEIICARFSKNTRPVPGIKLSEIPDDAKTLCVITSLLRGEEFDKSLFSKLEKIYNANSGRNIKFGLLCDLSDCDYATSADDEKTISYASGRIDSLNTKYGNSFILFIRPRSYSKSERCFMAYERKRGAVIELTKLIKSDSSSFDTSIKSLSDNLRFIKNTKYVITLDADTNLGIDTAKELVGKMLHPHNSPVIDRKKRCVVSGYGIMQPKMSTELDGARKTAFSRLMCDCGGVDIYSGASFELYQSLFGEGIFCGKGIFDVNAFYETITLSPHFPDDSILSHDILEGEKLKTALLCDIELTDGFPKNELSYLKRKHRWIRGDIQNIRFISPKYEYSALSRYKLFDNVRRVFTPIISLVIIIASVFLPQEYSFVLFITAFAPYIMPFIIDGVNMVSKLAIKSAARKFFSKGVTVAFWQSFLRMLFFEAMLAKDALLSLGAAITSGYRMCFSKRKLLEWVTAAQSDSGKTDAALFITKHIFSCIIGALIFIFSSSGLIKLAGFSFFAMPFIGYFTSKEKKDETKTDEDCLKKLKAYAADIWKFFDENVNEYENFLPPDNIQLSPYEKIAHRTSPTNIGLYLVSALCARDMGFIDTKEFYFRINKSLGTITKLGKFKGHLFNWYDTKTLEVLSPRYISSVDSGNFVACLVTLKNGILDYAGDEPRLLESAKKISELIANTDFSFLFNKQRELFYVGAEIGNEAKCDKGCYDLFMSESRILSYYACASRIVPKTHFKKLARPLITAGGYIGLSSWSGTAFEYFMPALFMPVKRGSMIYEAMLFAYKAQSARKLGKEKVWGISESGYFSFDCDLNYQYKAFGVPMLGRTNGNKKQAVISPYSSFLSTCVSAKGACENLERLAKMGMYGKYGFYEAVDFTRSRVKTSHAIVKSYMSHHLGMSMLAIANVTENKAVMRRFMLDNKMSCGNELLEEKIPVNAIVKRMRKTSTPVSLGNRAPQTETVCAEDYSFKAPIPVCLSDGKATCIISDCGHISFSKSNVLINYSSFKKNFHETPESFHCYLEADGKIIGMTPLSKKPGSDCKFGFSYSESFAEHTVSCDKGDFKLSYTISPQKLSPIRLKLSGKTKANSLRVCFAFSPCLSKRNVYEAHPAFAELFTEAVFDEDENILFYRKRQRSSGDEETVLAIAFTDKTKTPFFSTRKEYKTENSSVFDPYRLFSDDIKNDIGACINPFCIFGTQLGKSSDAELILLMSHSINSAKEAILSERKFSFESAVRSLSETNSQFTVGSGISSLGSCKTVDRLLSDIIFGTDTKNCKYIKNIFSEKNHGISVNSLWKYGISGDLPIVCADIGSYFFSAPIEKRVRAFRLLTMKNIRSDLVILYNESDKYDRKIEKKLSHLIHSCGGAVYLGRNTGGIHILDKEHLGSDIYALKLKASSYTDIYCETSLPQKRIISKKAFLPVIKGKPCDIPTGSFTVNCGSFEQDSFCVDKTKTIKAPMAHILSGENISTVVTENSLGYTFYKNASECRITPFTGGGNSPFFGEKLFILQNGVLFDLAQCCSYVKYFPDKAEYFGRISNMSYKISIFCLQRLPAKIIKCDLKGDTDNAQLLFAVTPCMGRFAVKNAVCKTDSHTILFSNPLSESFSEYHGFLKVVSSGNSFCECNTDNALFGIKSETREAVSDGICGLAKLEKEKESCIFILGAEKNGSDILKLVEKSAVNGDAFASGQTFGLCESLLPNIRFTPKKQTDEAKSLSVMFNRHLAHSCIVSRMLARSGYYQSGGAYGFRDQLQDCLMLMYSDKRRSLTHICRAASHQFIKGDVLHWWHEKGKKGIRSTCSDDYLWLVFAICEYFSYSGSHTFLDISVPYIKGDELSENENEKYISFENSHIKESLYYHATRSLDRACTLIGEHGLCLMGSCDWCDGYSGVGKNKKGESTFTTMFLIMNLLRFSEICAIKNDFEKEFYYKDTAEKLKGALMKHCYDGENRYFIRGFYDDCSPLGAQQCDEGKTDLMAQCLSPMCKIESDVCKNAFDTAYERLFDKKYGILKLLDPPFDKTQKDPGYIKGYLKGVRENGGQYTHGALLFALGCFVLSDALYEKDAKSSEKYTEMGESILKFSNPAFRCSQSAGKDISEAYLTEPYAVAADIYSNHDHIGRGGWTHYTGASGWFYRLILRYVFGIEVYGTDTDSPYIQINAKRNFPMSEITDGGEVHFCESGFDLHILYIKDGKKRVTSEGKVIENGKISKSVKKIEVHI